VSQPQSTAVTGTELAGVQNPIFSPDGRFLAFWSAADRTIKRIAVSGGAAGTICQADAPFGMSWGPDDAIVFGQADKGIMRVSAKGGAPETIAAVQGNEWAHGPHMLPGGKALLFTLAYTTGSGSLRWDQARIIVQLLNSGERKTVLEGGSDARYVPTGHLIYVLRGALWAVPFDIQRLEVTGGPVRIIEGVRVSSVVGASNTGTVQFDFSGNGSLVYIAASSGPESPRRVALADRVGNIKPLPLPPALYVFPRLSPDGKQLAVVTDDGNEAITWIYELSGAASLRRLTFGGRNDSETWSGDGQWLILRSTREGDTALFRQRADGSGSPERLTKPEAGVGQAASGIWSGPNQMFTFTEYKGAEYDVWVYSMADRKATPFDNTPGSEQIVGVFSPDGKWIAYSSNETGKFEIFVQPYPKTTAKYQITRDGGGHPRWSPDGKELFFQNNGNLYSVAIQRQPKLAWGDPVLLSIKGFYQQDVRPRHYDITPDGKQFVMVFPVEALTKTVDSPQIQIVLNWFEELKQRVPVH
jgi:dipeptidyl aminopeptidase/acylaminoacyl peptidase